MKLRQLMTMAVACLMAGTASAQSVRETIRLDEGWKFALGNASDPAKDFGCGTEYFNYLTKANSLHNEGPYSKKFDDSAWEEVRVPHDWVTTLPYAREASHSHGYKTVGYKYPETSVGWYRKNVKIEKNENENELPYKYYLQFDGIFRDARVWFNGYYMGTEPSGYATQVYDVTEYVNYGGDNLICVRADATLEEGWFYEGAGIYRDAWLVKTAAVSVAPFGTFVYADLKAPYDQANLYYMGKLGRFTIDFNADYTDYQNRSSNEQQELSRNYENRDVHTETQTRGRMVAEKLIVSLPLWKGQLSIGEEYTNTRWRSSFENAEGYIQNSNNEQHESNIAPFVELQQRLGRFQLQAGLRYEHVASDYFVGCQHRSDQSRTYDDLFPSVAISAPLPWGGAGGGLSISYAKRTNRPAYWLLSNDVVYENRLNMQRGNPYLRPVKYHNFSVMAMWKGIYLTTNFFHCVNPFMTVMESTEQDSKVNMATTRNYDHANWLIVTLGMQRDIRLGSSVTWTPQYNVTMMKQWLTTTFNSQDKHLGQPMLSLQLGNIVALPHDWLLQADFSMHTHGYTGSNFKIESTNPMLSLSVSKDFFQRRLNIKLTGNDLFNQGKSRGTFYFDRMIFRKTEDNDTRCVSLSLRYRFNVTPSKYKGTGAGNAEKSRL